MSIFDLDGAGVAAIDEQARLHPWDPTKDPPSAWAGTGQAFKGLLAVPAQTGRTLMMAGAVAPLAFDSAAGLFRQDGNDNAAGDWYFKHVVDDVGSDAVDYWTPDASTMGGAARVVNTASTVVGSLPTMIAAPSLFLGNAAFNPATDLVRKGVDSDTALAVGGLSLGVNALGLKLPAAFGKTLSTRMATGAGENLVLGAGGDAASAAVLRASGNAEEAKSYDATDPHARMLDVLMGVAFGGAAHLQARTKDAAASRVVGALSEINQAEKDAILTANNADHFQRQTMPGEPLTAGADVAHQRALDAAIDQALRGEPVDVAGKVDLADFELRPELRPDTELPAPPRMPADPYNMTADEVHEHADAVAGYGDDIERAILGDQLDPWRKAVRQSESRDAETAARGAADVEAIESKLSPADRDALYGIGRDTEAFDDLADFQQAHSDAMVRSPDEASEAMARFLVQLGGTEGTDPSQWPRPAQAAYAGMRTLRERIAEEGWDSKEIQKQAVLQAGGKFGDRIDAEYMLGRFVKPAEAPPRAAPAIAHEPAESVDPLDAPNFGLPEAPRTIAPEDPFWQSIPEGKNGRETANIDTPERQALREQLVDEHFAHAAPPRPAGERPVAYVMGGGGASGKGTLLAQLQADGGVPTGLVHVDPDAIKAGEHGISGIPEYRQMVDRGDSRAAAVVHEESSQIAVRVKDRAIAERRDFVLDRTLGDPAKAAKEIQALKDAGYEVRLFGVTLDASEAIKRAVKRARGKGRYVPLGALLKAHKGFASGFEQYAKMADSAVLFDNTTEPQVIAQAQGGRLQILNDQAYNQFRARRSINDQASTHRELAAEADARLREESDQARGMGEGQGGQGSGGAGVGSPQRLEAGDRGTGAAQGQRLDPQTFPVQGKSSTVTTERGLQVPVRWAVADIANLVTSHDEALNINPAFPAELQPRDRSRAASEQQIARIANAINPELLAESPKASDGAPVVGADRVVESGNARTIALRRAYAAGKADAYRAYLLANAERFGLDPAKLDGMQQPVLVRVTEGDYNRAEFARQANESTVAAMSTTEQALADARHLPDMGDLHTNDDGSINMRASAKFVHGFIEGVGPNERGAMSTADGELSQQGQARIRNAVFARAYGDAELVAMMAEATDANVKNVLAGMLRAAPAIARLREMIAEGGRFGPDIAPDLVSAVRKFSQLRRDGTTVAQYEAQGDFFGEGGLSPRARELLHTVGENARAPKRMAEFLQRYVDAVHALGDPRQADVFGDMGTNRTDAALRQAGEATRAANDTPTPQAGSLFNAAGRPTDAAKAAPKPVAEPAEPAPKAAAEQLAAASPVTPETRAAYEAIAANPELMIVGEDGTPVPAAEFIARMEAESAADQHLTRGVAAAASCLLRSVA